MMEDGSHVARASLIRLQPALFPKSTIVKKHPVSACQHITLHIVLVAC